MKFQANLGRVVTRDGEVYTADDKGIIDLPETLGKAYKFTSVETKTSKKK